MIVLSILDIYRKCFGSRVALYILRTFYLTMAVAGYLVEVLFGGLGVIPTQRDVLVFTTGPNLNYTNILNIAFLVLAAFLVFRFLPTGGPQMLRMMNAPEHAGEHDHDQQKHASHAAV